MKEIIRLSLLLAVLMVGLSSVAFADTIISIKPELSLQSDGKAIIVNALPYCSDADLIYIDTTTGPGKSMFSMILSVNAAEKEIYIQTPCTCNANCSNVGQVLVYKVCTKLNGDFCL